MKTIEEKSLIATINFFKLSQEIGADKAKEKIMKELKLTNDQFLGMILIAAGFTE